MSPDPTWLAFLDRLAEARMSYHQGSKWTRPLAPNFARIGMAGELAARVYFLVPWDEEELCHMPEGGPDLILIVGGKPTTFDVKTSRGGILRVEEHKIDRYDAYIFARYDEETATARVLHWATRGMITRSAALVPSDYDGRNNWEIEARLLPGIRELRKDVSGYIPLKKDG